MKFHYYFISTVLVCSFFICSCNKTAKRYTAKSINPELIGTWSNDNNSCALQLVKQNESLILLDYHDQNKRNLNNVKLSFTTYSIETKLKAIINPKIQFNAKYIDGTIIIDTYCSSPLRKLGS